jgi:hypothetical protein
MNLYAFPFYANLNSQDRFRRRCSGSGVFGHLTDATRFPPFQIRRDKTGILLDCVHVYNIDGTLYQTLIHPAFPYTLHQGAFEEYVTYYGGIVTGLVMPCGFYYLEVGGLFSEVFQVADDLSSAVEITWQNSRPLGSIYYGAGFVQSFITPNEILEPDYKFDEEGDLNGDEIFVRDTAKLSKLRLLESGLIPEYLVDALNAVPLHDEVSIGEFTDLGKLTAKTTWAKGACRANVTLTFEDESPVLWRACDTPETVVEVSQVGHEPNVAVCNGEEDLRPRWSNTGNVRCKTVEFFASAAISEQVARNNCAAGQTTETITYTLPSGRFESLVSQNDADIQARTFFDQTKQQYANATGVCVSPRSVAITNVSKTPKTAIVTVTRTDGVGDLFVNLYVEAEVDGGPGVGIYTAQVNGQAHILANDRSKIISLSFGGAVVQHIMNYEISSVDPEEYAF